MGALLTVIFTTYTDGISNSMDAYYNGELTTLGYLLCALLAICGVCLVIRIYRRIFKW